MLSEVPEFENGVRVFTLNTHQMFSIHTFQNVFRQYKNVKPKFSNSSGLKSVFEKLRFRDGVVWTPGSTGRRNKAAFFNFSDEMMSISSLLHPLLHHNRPTKKQEASSTRVKKQNYYVIFLYFIVKENVMWKSFVLSSKLTAPKFLITAA